MAKVTGLAAIKELKNCEDVYLMNTIALLQLFVENLRVWEGGSDSN